MSLIDIDDKNIEDTRPVEVPFFSIESDNNSRSDSFSSDKIITVKQSKKRNRWIVAAFIIVAVTVIGVLLWAYRYEFIRPKVPFSVSDSDNIAILEEPYSPSEKGTTVTADSVLGVAFDIYSLHGLKASLEAVMPDTTDKSLVLFMRSADYHPDGRLIGTIVADGHKTPGKERKSRPAYVAISKDGLLAIGSSLGESMVKNAEKNGGSFFRQFSLLGDGELPEKFRLHGKVERAAIGRMADGKMYYVVTRHKETMYDFADALREYGFVDAVYISGGNSYTFHRTSDGNAHVTPQMRAKYGKYSSGQTVPPLLVFRN